MYVLGSTSDIGHEFEDDRKQLRATKGEVFFLPGAPLGEGAHRERNLW